MLSLVVVCQAAADGHYHYYPRTHGSKRGILLQHRVRCSLQAWLQHRGGRFTFPVLLQCGLSILQAVLSFIVLVILLLSTGPKPGLRVLPWFIRGQLALDAFMFIIWIAAAGVSQYNCNDLCGACSGYDDVWADGLYCVCSFFYKRDQSPAPKGLARSIQERATHRGPALGRVAGKTALNSIIV